MFFQIQVVFTGQNFFVFFPNNFLLVGASFIFTTTFILYIFAPHNLIHTPTGAKEQGGAH